MKQKFYAVKKGRHPGIYHSWPACQKEVIGFPGAVYKSFLSLGAAQQWLQLSDNRDQAQSSQSASRQFDIKLYTDGGSRNHGNKLGQHVKANDKAAWAYLIEYHGQQLTATGGEYGSTNNKMEINALVQALQYLLAHGLNHYSIIATLDSHYVLDPITKGWLYGWQRRQWVTAAGKPVANKELWQRILQLLPEFDDLHFTWTKGHATNLGNNTVDELLNTTMDKM